MSRPMSWVDDVVLRVGRDRVDQRLRAEDVVAHRGEHLVGCVRKPDRVLRLLAERDDLAAVVGDLHHAELARLLDRHPQPADRDAGAALEVLATIWRGSIR